MARDELVYLRHILDAINTVEEYLQGVDEKQFNSTRLLQDGVIRQIEIVGEAVPACFKRYSQNISRSPLAGCCRNARQTHPRLLRRGH